jgi:Ca2+-binding EF-hand superfamily protein
LLAAEKVLHRWDLDGDEIVLVGELQPGLSAPGMTFYAKRGPSTPVKDFPFHVVGESGLFTRLLGAYDKDKDGALSAGELRVGKKTFARLDADGNGKVTPDEWKDEALSPQLELTLPLGPGVKPDVVVVPGRKGHPTVRHSPVGAALVPFAGQRLEVVQVSGAKVQALAREQALDRFRNLDRNGDKSLDSKELFQPPFALVPVSRLADRDGDGNLSEKEYAGFLDLRAQIQKAATFLTVADQGKTLFGAFDADHDGRLSRRELKSAWKRLEPWEPVKGKGFARKDVPRQWQLLVSHGAPPVRGNNGRSLRLPPRGPVWFQKMDRNRDGDVSAAEFLGKTADFRTIDADRDGLIDPDEATKADARFRSGR